MKRIDIRRMVLAGVFLSLGIVLPMFTMQIKEIGDSLLPMHFPVMLCGLLCGFAYGAAVGLMIPFMRSFMFGMPMLFPNAVWMSAELLTYGLVIGIVYCLFKKKTLLALYVSLITSMIAGRVIWGIVKLLLLGLKGNSFTFTMFITGGFTDALPGIVLQLIFIPSLVVVINNTKSKKRKINNENG